MLSQSQKQFREFAAIDLEEIDIMIISIVEKSHAQTRWVEGEEFAYLLLRRVKDTLNNHTGVYRSVQNNAVLSVVTELDRLAESYKDKRLISKKHFIAELEKCLRPLETVLTTLQKHVLMKLLCEKFQAHEIFYNSYNECMTSLHSYLPTWEELLNKYILKECSDVMSFVKREVYFFEHLFSEKKYDGQSFKEWLAKQPDSLTMPLKTFSDALKNAVTAASRGATNRHRLFLAREAKTSRQLSAEAALMNFFVGAAQQPEQYFLEAHPVIEAENFAEYREKLRSMLEEVELADEIKAEGITPQLTSNKTQLLKDKKTTKGELIKGIQKWKYFCRCSNSAIRTLLELKSTQPLEKIHYDKAADILQSLLPSWRWKTKVDTYPGAWGTPEYAGEYLVNNPEIYYIITRHWNSLMPLINTWYADFCDEPNVEELEEFTSADTSVASASMDNNAHNDDADAFQSFDNETEDMKAAPVSRGPN